MPTITSLRDIFTQKIRPPIAKPLQNEAELTKLSILRKRHLLIQNILVYLSPSNSKIESHVLILFYTRFRGCVKRLKTLENVTSSECCHCMLFY